MVRRLAFLITILTSLALLVVSCGQQNVSSTPTPLISAAPTSPVSSVTETPQETQGGTPVTSPSPTVTPQNTVTASTTPAATEVSTSGSSENGYPFTYTDATGHKVTLRSQPRRIVSLFPSNNETVFAIGAGDQVIAVDQFTSYPKEAAEKPKIKGTYQKFNIEQIVSLKPDLVLSSLGAEQIVDKPLRDAGITVINMGYPGTIDQVVRHIRDLGRITGHTEEADKLASQLEDTVEQVKSKTSKLPKVRVYFESDISTPGKPYTYGAGSLVDQMITIAGGRNIFGSVKNPFPQVSYESIVRRNPQVIILGDVKGFVGPDFLNPTTVEDVKSREGFSTIEAVKKNRVVPVNPDLYTTPGPRLTQAIKQLAAIIHPEVFGER